mmetsp:Transcript_22757/g.54080  ORF Transcript_22757/g.54080 Transcript_22757/m.54080 type:complete len:213 (-) Transcript_22757:1005-1643(-)
MPRSMPPRPTNRLLGGACPLGRGLEGGDRQDVRVGGLGGGDRQQARGPLLNAGLVTDGVHDHHGVAVGHDAGLLASVEGGTRVVAVAARLEGVHREGVAHVALDHLADMLVVAHRDDGRLRVELGEEARGLAGLGEDDDGLGADVARGLDGGRCHRLARAEADLVLLGLLHQLEDLVVARAVLVAHQLLRLAARAGHDLHGALGEATVGGLA